VRLVLGLPRAPTTRKNYGGYPEDQGPISLLGEESLDAGEVAPCPLITSHGRGLFAPH